MDDLPFRLEKCRMKGEASDHGELAGADVLSHTGPRERLNSIEERRRLVAESLRVGNPGNRAKDLPGHADPKRDCQIELKVADTRRQYLLPPTVIAYYKGIVDTMV